MFVFLEMLGEGRPFDRLVLSGCGDEAVEGGSVLCADGHAVGGGVVGDNENFLEQGLVELAFEVVGGAGVGGAAVFEQVQGGGQGAIEVVDAAGGGTGLLVEVGERLGKAVLFASEQVEGYGSGVVGFEQFGALPFELGSFGVVAALGRFGFAAGASQFVPEAVFYLLAERRGQAEATILLVEFGLDLIDEDGFLGAAGALGVPPSAHEVGVGVSRGGAGHLHEEPFAALAAVQTGLEVVGMASGAFAVAVAGKDVLHLGPGVVVDEWLVTAGMLHPLEGHEALVVGVGEELAQQ